MINKKSSAPWWENPVDKKALMRKKASGRSKAAAEALALFLQERQQDIVETSRVRATTLLNDFEVTQDTEDTNTWRVSHVPLSQAKGENGKRLNILESDIQEQLQMLQRDHRVKIKYQLVDHNGTITVSNIPHFLELKEITIGFPSEQKEAHG